MADAQFYLDKITGLLGEEPLGEVEEELFKWYLFGHYDNGSSIRELDVTAFAAFKEKLIPLLDIVYQWHQEKAVKG